MSLLSTHIFKNNKKETQTCQINILKPPTVNKEKMKCICLSLCITNMEYTSMLPAVLYT